MPDPTSRYFDDLNASLAEIDALAGELDEATPSDRASSESAPAGPASASPGPRPWSPVAAMEPLAPLAPPTAPPRGRRAISQSEPLPLPSASGPWRSAVLILIVVIAAVIGCIVLLHAAG